MIHYSYNFQIHAVLFNIKEFWGLLHSVLRCLQIIHQCDITMMNFASETMLLLLGILFLVPSTFEWQNGWDGSLNVQCSDKQGFYRVRSQHSNYYEDRLWQWDCHTVAEKSFSGECYWTGWLNGWDQPVYAQCEPNYILAGVNSYHVNWAEDRRWKIRCCQAENHFTRNCEVSNYLNWYDGWMDYSVSAPKVFTGIFSAHMNSPE